MPSTVVHAGFALLLAAGLLANAYDRKALAVVLVIIVIPEIDTLLGPIMPGAHRTVGHNVVFPVAIALLLLYDTRLRDRSALRDRFDDWGVRVAWVGLFAHVFAHLFLDWAHLEGINMFWPIHDEFFRLEGELYLSTTEGLTQTFVEIAADPESGETTVDAGGTGTTESVHVSNPVEPDAATDTPSDEPVDRRFPIAQRGWRLYLVLVGVFVVVARRFQADLPAEE
ncbi:metal-dependent hydrolase [Halorubrum vacuolatum]|uniref:LexA-binding, inner membrane-associated putative hydrolase n=1 Tax=Halorubrum vacuolatum TaxID=63740 RepID=A0A238UQT5_HALVU|nr:metal-dependent hydrolase [Halorubrum vacuolatum]SNR24027.1 LexA-binding, inner membrane-associated putative hydrolase [Halorubrum vacuolatum]